MKMEYDKTKLEMEERVAKAKARPKVLSTFDDVSLQKYKKEDQLLTGDGNRKNKKTPLLRKDPVFHKNETKIEDQKFSHQSRLNCDCKEFIPGKKYFSDDLSHSTNHELNKNYQSDGEVSNMLCKILQQQGAPEVDIDTFSGDRLEYHYFMEVFKEVVEKRIKNPRGRFTRLIKYTTGEAKDLIKHCIQQPSAEGYENAMKLLENRYGDPLKILASYEREIKKWSSIRVGDATAFRQFHNFLLKYESVISMQNWSALDSPELLS